jgi:very-short-patch-repair endonuclease
MGHRPFIPKGLAHRPFTVEEARRAGLTRWQLEGGAWTRLGPSTYVSTPLANDPVHKLVAALRRLPDGAAFSGLTAAWLHGLDVPPCSPIEVTVAEGAGVSARSGIAVRRSTFARGDVVRARDLPATSVLRTVGELCGRLPLVEAVVIADAALHDRRLKPAQMSAWAAANAGRRGIKNLRRVLDHVDPASESPMESRLRMLLVLGGLPRPKAQVSIHNRWGRFAGRPDLYYEAQKLGIEYDGGVHRDRLAEDDRRQNRLLDAGVRLLRFTAGDVLGNPESVVSQVRLALAGVETTPASAGGSALAGPSKGASAGARV